MEDVTFTYRGQQVTYGTVLSPTGRIWMDRNLGATRVANAYNDSSAYGHYFQWGRLDDGHQVASSGTTDTLSETDNPGHDDFILSSGDWRSSQNDNLWQLQGQSPCPEGWRVPTQAEWEEEIATWDTQDKDGAFGSVLKLTTAGRRAGVNGTFYFQGTDARYWSSTVSTVDAITLVASTSISLSAIQRSNGHSVRLIKILPPRMIGVQSLVGVSSITF